MCGRVGYAARSNYDRRVSGSKTRPVAERLSGRRRFYFFFISALAFRTDERKDKNNNCTKIGERKKKKTPTTNREKYQKSSVALKMYDEFSFLEILFGDEKQGNLATQKYSLSSHLKSTHRRATFFFRVGQLDSDWNKNRKKYFNFFSRAISTTPVCRYG